MAGGRVRHIRASRLAVAQTTIREKQLPLTAPHPRRHPQEGTGPPFPSIRPGDPDATYHARRGSSHPSRRAGERPDPAGIVQRPVHIRGLRRPIVPSRGSKCPRKSLQPGRCAGPEQPSRIHGRRDWYQCVQHPHRRGLQRRDGFIPGRDPRCHVRFVGTHLRRAEPNARQRTVHVRSQLDGASISSSLRGRHWPST